MATNLVEKLATELGYSPLHKIDPNTQETEAGNQPTHNLGQAVVSVALVGLYKCTRSHAGADDLQRGNISTPVASTIFGNEHEPIAEKIAAYAGVPVTEASDALEGAMTRAIHMVKEEVGDQEDGIAFRTFLTNQRSNILQYLPPAMHIGENLNDSTVDDHTNKMEGPVSSFMHTVEKAFSVSDSDKDQKLD